MRKSESTRHTYLALLLLGAFLLAGAWGVNRVVDNELAHQRLLWQDRLGVVADSRVDAIERWLDARRRFVAQLAGNTSLQLYLSQLVFAEEGLDTSPERTWLRDLLLTAADRSGYVDKDARQGIGANLPGSGRRGIALLDASGNLILSTRDFPVLDAAMRTQIEIALHTDGPSIRDLFLNVDEEPSMAFFAPVYAVQGNDMIGLVMAMRPVGEDLYPLLSQRGLTTHTHEALLLRREGDLVRYLSPQADGTAPLKRVLQIDPDGLAAGLAISAPGHFAQRRDYRGIPVLLTSRPVAGMPWILMQKLDRDEALSASDDQARGLAIGLLLLVGLLATLLVAAWWYGASVRSRQAAASLREANERILGQSLMLNAITDNSNDFLAILDAAGTFVFANRALADAVGVEAPEFVGKTTAAMFGAEVAKRLEADLEDGDDHPVELVETLEIGGRSRRYSSYRIALPPAAGLSHGTSGSHLLVMRDVTDLLAAEERQERLMWELVTTLSGVLDQHDPYSANHSRVVANVAEQVARLLELDRGMQNTLRIAGLLINIGKLWIPRSLLTKEGKLTDEERAILTGHPNRAREVLAGIDFEGPVAESVGQSGELLDGSGTPNGLSGDQIILPARILSAVNGFVAMTRPRAWRTAMTRQQAIDQLTAAPNRYDRRVVAALYHFISKYDDAEWAHLWED